MPGASNGLRVNSVEERNDYRSAVSAMLLDIQRDNRVTLIDIAEKIDVSLGTISNAANKKNDLCATFLCRLANAYGPHVLDHFTRLSGGRVVPLEGGNVRDILPFLTRAVAKIADFRDPGSEGGGRMTHREKLALLPDLEHLQAELSKTICEYEALRLKSVA